MMRHVMSFSVIAIVHLNQMISAVKKEPPSKCVCGGFIQVKPKELHSIYQRAFNVHFDCSDRNKIRCRNMCEAAASANTNDKGLSQWLPSINSSVGDYACRRLQKDLKHGTLIVKFKLCKNDWMDTRFQLLHPICCKNGTYNCA